ncbi:MAG: hypothetical protein WDN46_17390 [Methylocella sp.]
MPTAECPRASDPFHYARNVYGSIIEWCVVALMTLLGVVAPWRIERLDHAEA